MSEPSRQSVPGVGKRPASRRRAGGELEDHGHAEEVFESDFVGLHGRHIRDPYLVEAQHTRKRHKNLPSPARNRRR